MRRLPGEQSNSSLVLQDAMVMKVIRRLLPGVHPEAEMGRTLTALGYANAPKMLGEVARIGKDGTRHTMILLQQFIHNQGDAWQWTLDTVARWFQQTAVSEPATMTEAQTEIVAPRDDLLQLSAMLGQRLGEMHAALATATDNPDFSPEPVGREEAMQWAEGARRQLEAAFDVLRGKIEWSNEAEAARAARLLGRRDRLLAQLERLAEAGIGTLRMRIHGDFHLGQVLVAQRDVYIVDFEGEPAKPLDQRRAKASPMRDVAGLLRSFDYVAAFAGKAGPADLDEAAERRKQHIIRHFAPICQAAFLDAYRKAAYVGPLQMSPQTERGLLQLLRWRRPAMKSAMRRRTARHGLRCR